MSNILGTEQKIDGIISNNNRSTTPLTATQVFVGQWDRVDDYSQLTVNCRADVPGELYLEVSQDGLEVDFQKPITVNVKTVHTLVITAKYFRVRYVNGATPQAVFRLQVLYHTYKSKELTSTLVQDMTDSTDVQVNRSVIAAKNTRDEYDNVRSNQFNDLITTLSFLDRTAFGEIKTAQLTPIIQELFTYNINSRKYSTISTGSGSITQANSMGIVSTGTTAGSTSSIEALDRIRYRPGEGCMCRFTGLFTTPVLGTTQLIGVGDENDGFFVGYDTTGDFGFMHRNSASGSIVETWYYQSTWNADLADGTQSLPAMNWQNGNIFAIQYQYLGFGSIRLYIEKSHLGEFILCNTIDYANENQLPSLSNPTLPFRMSVDNGAIASDIVLKTASVGFFVEGESRVRGLSNAVTHNKTGIGSTETSIISLRNKATYASQTNTELIFPVLLNIATIGGNKPVIINLYKNETLTAPTYNDVDTNTSIAEFDVVGGLVGNGTLVTTLLLGKEDTGSLDLKQLNLKLVPGENLCITASTGSGTVEVFASITFIDDI